MRVGIISDIHSNQTALEAVLEHMDDDLDEIICCGDIVGYGPRPKECLDIVRERCSVIVQGNHDRNVAQPERYRANNMAYRGLQHSQESLTEEEVEWLSDLPKKKEFKSYLIAHSHPTNTGKYVYPREFDGIIQYAVDNNYDGVMLGHTHVQHHTDSGTVFCLNPGSVGQPRDNDNRAGYAVLDTQEDSIELERVRYDIEQTKRRIEQQGLPRRTGSRLKRGE